MGKVIHKGYTYSTSYTYTNNGKPIKRYLRCVFHKKANCKARAIKTFTDKKQIILLSNHNHPPDENQTKMSKFLADIKDSIGMGLPLQSIYDYVAEKNQEAALQRSFKSVQSTMSRWRSSYQEEKYRAITLNAKNSLDSNIIINNQHKNVTDLNLQQKKPADMPLFEGINPNVRLQEREGQIGLYSGSGTPDRENIILQQQILFLPAKSLANDQVFYAQESVDK